jgi:hypothetical protein
MSGWLPCWLSNWVLRLGLGLLPHSKAVAVAAVSRGYILPPPPPSVTQHANAARPRSPQSSLHYLPLQSKLLSCLAWRSCLVPGEGWFTAARFVECRGRADADADVMSSKQHDFAFQAGPGCCEPEVWTPSGQLSGNLPAAT